MTNTITEPGMFEGEPTYTRHFYDLMLDGGGYDDNDTYDDRSYDGPAVTIFWIEDEDRAKFPDLGDAITIRLWEDDQGFVYHELEMPEADNA